MMSKIVNRLNSINDYSKKIIIWSSFISLIVCACGIGVIAYNSLTVSTVSLQNIGSSLIHASIVMFSQFIIGSLVIDFIGTVFDKDE